MGSGVKEQLNEKNMNTPVKPSPVRKRGSPPGHFVYLFRDKQGRCKYVGYGISYRRATSHLSGSHNKGLNRFLRDGDYTLEIAGPFATKETGRAVETSLISVLNPDFNRDPGETRWRFRPLGVPKKYANRLTLPPLGRKELLGQLGRSASCSILFVYVNDKKLRDGRVGYDPSTPPSDSKILQRMDEWWQLGRYVQDWSKAPLKSPSVLVGVSGRPDSRFVIGAVRINKSGWENARSDGGLFQIPTNGPRDLDAFGFRGRRISAKANIKFGAFSHQFFIILGRDGKSIGGHPSSRIRL